MVMRNSWKSIISMLDYYTVKRLALILSAQAEIEGMKVENLINTSGLV